MTILVWLVVMLVSTVPCPAQGDEVIRIYSRRWPTGTLAFQGADDLGACLAEQDRSGRAGAVCATGARYWLNNGVRVQVTGTSGDAATVTIMDGRHAGEHAVVAADELSPTGGPERKQPARRGTDADRQATAKAEADANARAARIKAAGAARARCVDSCLGVPYGAANLPQCEDGCRAVYQRAVR